MKSPFPNKLSQVALRTAAIYAFVGAVWILLSDEVMRALVSEDETIRKMEVYKGWAFVAATAILLYTILRGQLRRWEKETQARQKAEEALRLSEERFELAIRGANDGIWDWNLEANTIYYSPRWKSMLGYADHELENTPENWKSRVHPDDLPAAEAQVTNILAGQADIFEAEFRMRHKDGHWVHILSRAFSVKKAAGRVIRLVGTHLDITDRKLAAEAIHRSEERHRALVETSFDWIWELDADTRYTFVSPHVSALLGYSQEEILGKTPFDFMPDGQARQARAFFTMAIAQRRSFAAQEKEYLHKDGRRVILESSGVPMFGPNKDFRGYRGSDRNITERKIAEKERQALEAQLRQAQKMEAIGTLAGGVAHDFNNLLTVIQGNAALLLNPPTKALNPAECAQQIIRASERAAGLTRQLLMFSRKQVLQISNINLNEAVGHMTKMLQRILGEDIALQTNYGPNMGVMRGDVGMIEQVLLNLVVNSRDAMPHGGWLTIDTGTDMLSEKEAKPHADASPGLHVWVSVTDTGEGIAPENMPRVFEPFFTTKEVGKGTGLGLATVYGIVKQHRGWITIDSTVNQGTTVRIHFPALPAAASPPVKKYRQPAAPLPRGSETIMVAEDDPAVRVLMTNLLKDCGYRVLEAESGAAALQVWQQHRHEIDLLLTDLVMPDGVSGLQLAEQLKNDQPSLKVIYVTGYSSELASGNAALVEGVNFLQKPFLPEALARALRILLNRD